MGKNQAHKARQMQRHGGTATGEDGQPLGGGDGMKDATFHTAEWHAARIASLTAERPAWEDWKAKQKEAESKLRQTEEEEERRQRKRLSLLHVNIFRVQSQRTRPSSHCTVCMRTLTARLMV